MRVDVSIRLDICNADWIRVAQSYKLFTLVNKKWDLFVKLKFCNQIFNQCKGRLVVKKVGDGASHSASYKRL